MSTYIELGGVDDVAEDAFTSECGATDVSQHRFGRWQAQDIQTHEPRELFTDEVNKIETVLNNSFQFKIPAHMRNRNKGAHDITGVYDVTCKESFNNVSVQTMGSTSMFLTVMNKLLAKNQEELPTEETTTEPAAEPPVEITKNESADQAEDRGTRRGEGGRVHRTSWRPGER